MEMINCTENEERLKLYTDIVKREKLEDKANGSLTEEILKKLNIDIENFPQETQNILRRTADLNSSLSIENIDSASLSLYQTRQISRKLQDDYEILKLQQKTNELQRKIDKNDIFLKEFNLELVNSKKRLASKSIHEYTSQLKQKNQDYEKSLEKTMKFYASLGIPETILPKHFESQITLYNELKDKEKLLKQEVDCFL